VLNSSSYSGVKILGKNTLKTADLTKQFGVLPVVPDISFSIREWTIHPIVAPKGSRKTTFFNLLTGQLKPTRGNILFRHHEITGLSVQQISHLGLTRPFQISNVTRILTMFENLAEYYNFNMEQTTAPTKQVT